MKIVSFILLSLLLICVSSCGLRVKTYHNWFGPDIYTLTDGNYKLMYYNGDCCCVAKQVLEKIKDEIKTGYVEWPRVVLDHEYKEYCLKHYCDELRGVKEVVK
jgi:hypothetical protein